MNLNDFAKGIKLALTKNLWDGDLYQCDGVVDDNIIQLALFGDVIYI